MNKKQKRTKPQKNVENNNKGCKADQKADSSFLCAAIFAACGSGFGYFKRIFLKIC